MILKKTDLPEDALYEMIPQDSEPVQRLMAYLDFEIRNALNDYSEYYDQLRIWRRMINAEPNIRVKTFPWPGASNLVIPTIRINADAIKARLINTLLTPKPFWVCAPLAKGGDMERLAKPWENFLEWAAESDMKLADSIEMMVDQVVYFGQCPMKVYWQNDVRKVRSYNQRTRKIEDKLKVYSDNPIIEPIMLENWLEPWGIGEMIQKPWLAHRVFYQINDLKAMKAQKRIYQDYDLDKLIGQTSSPPQEWPDAKRIAWSNVQLAEDLFEVCVDFDIDEDSFAENLTVLFSLQCPDHPLSVKYNFFWHQQKPYKKTFYRRKSNNRSDGDGMCQLLGGIQDGLTSFVNARTDNLTLTNTKFWKGQKGVVKDGMRIIPGYVFQTPNPEKDLIPVDIGQVSPLSFQHESILRDYSERLSGISDPQLGRNMDNPRVAATTTMAMLQEGDKGFDMVVRLLRVELGAIGTMVSQLYQQFKPRVPLTDILASEDVPLVDELLSMPPEQVEQSMLVSVNVSSVAMNEEAQRNAVEKMYAAIDQFYKNVIAIAQNLLAAPQGQQGTPTVPEAMKDMAIGMVETAYQSMLELLRSHKIANPDLYLYNPVPDLQAIRDELGTADELKDHLEGIMAGVPDLAGMGGMGAQPVGQPDQGAMAALAANAGGAGANGAAMGGQPPIA